ncbi:MAG: DUF1205 domain-containing protein [Micromonosporaceae bacterium]|nr:DUF1205 domain-containing protein [Micromonosporaceae bacterium]
MRVLFTTWAQSGHYQPLVPLGWALQAAGHQVVVAAPPPFARTITDSGLTALPAGPEVDVSEQLRRRFAQLSPEERAAATFEHPESRGAPVAPPPGRRNRDLAHNQLGRQMLRVVLDGTADMLDDVLGFARDWRPHLVVFEPTGFVGPVVAAILGIPTVRQLWAPDLCAPMQGISARILGPVVAPFGLSDVDITGTVTLDPCPPRLQVRDAIRRHPIRYVTYNGPMTVPTWLGRLSTGGRPRVCVTWGTTIHNLGLLDTYLAPRVLAALAGLDVEVVVAALPSQRETLGELPPNVVHCGPVPLRMLLPTCAAVVHQSGSGTTMSSVVCGVPQLTIPMSQDTIFIANQLAATGAGIHLRAAEADAQGIRAAVLQLLSDPGYAAAARRLRDEALALPAPADVVEQLWTLVGVSRRRPVPS